MGTKMGVTAMRRKSLYRAVAFLAAAGLIAGACGGSDDSAPADTSEETSEEAAAEEPAVEAGDEAEGDVDTAIEKKRAPSTTAVRFRSELRPKPLVFGHGRTPVHHLATA